MARCHQTFPEPPLPSSLWAPSVPDHLPQVAELSLQKFSSNVIEKCLTCGDHKVIGLIAAELQTTNSFGTLLHDPFANYVIQTLHARRVRGLEVFASRQSDARSLGPESSTL